MVTMSQKSSNPQVVKSVSQALTPDTQLAEQIAGKSTFTLATGKRAFYQQLQMTPAAAYEYAGEVGVRNSIHPDAIEGIRAFIEKRSPIWQGRR
jgi:enoyl-CoA hydratase/carnithine racemase